MLKIYVQINLDKEYLNTSNIMKIEVDKSSKLLLYFKKN